MIESDVELKIREYLEGKSWVVTVEPKKIGQHGVDVKAYHPKWRKNLLMEVKGGSGKNKHQEIHGAFYTVLGQILSRMDIEGNQNNKSRIYALAIPYEWYEAYKKKIKQMKYGWKLLKLRVYLVKNNGEVLERSYSHFLK